jgi:microcin C transport system substrate-binding protein
MRMRLASLSVALAVAMTAACSKSPAPEQNSGPAASNVPSAPSAPVSTNKNDYPVFPDADAGADPAVPADQGGKGFTGKGWETNTDFDLIGDPHAVKGGVLHDFFLDFPGTLRMEGPESNSYFNYTVTTMAYESLLGIHPTSLAYIPNLATHWKISPDKMTFWFRINPNARFSDGTPVTSDDVVATFDLMMDKTLESPSSLVTYGRFDRPVAESKYIVRVHSKELNWRNFMVISGMTIYPAHILKTFNGGKYLREYNYKLLPGSGPYIIREEDIVKGQSITVHRRKDYWAEKARANVGIANFDEISYVVVRDENLAFEKFKKGELDYYAYLSARQWVQETDFDNVQRGLVQKRKIFNSAPQGVEGFAFNTRQPPLDDIRVRKALTLLVDRKLMIEKLAFNQYTPLNSYFAGSVYENPNNPKNEFNPEQALALLAEAGWKDRDSQGRLVKNGQPLELELLYDSQPFEQYLTVYQDDLRKVGITLNLRLITPEQQFQLLMQRKFQMSLQAWGSTLFPDPEVEYGGAIADVPNTNNITGMKDPKLDAVLKAYDTMFDIKDRIQAIRQVDSIMTNAYQYALLWYAPYQRLIWWNKLGAPPGYLTRTGDFSGVLSLWWIDPRKDARLQQALRDSSLKLDVGPDEDRYWLNYGKQDELLQPQERKTP